MQPLEANSDDPGPREVGPSDRKPDDGELDGPGRDAPRAYGPWQIVESHCEYVDPWIRVQRDDVIRPDGDPGSYTVVHLKPGVCVVALDDEQHVHLTEEFHYGVGRVTLEGVSGGIEAGESALSTAQRELKEELGIEAREWIELGVCDPFTAAVVSPTRLYLARGLAFGEHQQEGTELIRHVRMPLADAIQRVMTGEVSHGPSAVVLLKVERYLKQASNGGS